MDWTRQLDNYCERTDFTFWSEPINAITNLAFLIAAYLVWRRVGHDRFAVLLLILLTAIGIGSFLFHTFATRWALMADVLPITAFILAYVFIATRRFFGAPYWLAALALLLFTPYAAAVEQTLRPITGSLNGSLGYVPVPILILAYAALLLNRDRRTEIGLAIGAGILILSLTFRTIDEAICPGFPLGTHFLWHVLNGIMLGWMILVMDDHRRRTGGP